jgi:hypothetical protein
MVAASANDPKRTFPDGRMCLVRTILIRMIEAYIAIEAYNGTLALRLAAGRPTVGPA